MLRCLLQRANNLRHSDPLASVTFRGKVRQGVDDTSQQRAATCLSLPCSSICIPSKEKPVELPDLTVSIFIFWSFKVRWGPTCTSGWLPLAVMWSAVEVNGDLLMPHPGEFSCLDRWDRLSPPPHVPTWSVYPSVCFLYFPWVIFCLLNELSSGVSFLLLFLRLFPGAITRSNGQWWNMKQKVEQASNWFCILNSSLGPWC